MNEKKTNALYPMVFVGMMAALIFVATYFIRIEIPTPTGPTNLRSATFSVFWAECSSAVSTAALRQA